MAKKDETQKKYRSFKDTGMVEPLETDRPEISAGIAIAIKRIIISDKTRYELIAKIDGVSPVDESPLKYRTFSKVLITKFTEMESRFCDERGTIIGNPILIKIVEKESQNLNPATNTPYLYLDIDTED